MIFSELREHVNGTAAATYCHDCGTTHREGECRYWSHVEAEGDGPCNENPDGCYNCGSPHHHSSDCPTDGNGNWGDDAF